MKKKLVIILILMVLLSSVYATKSHDSNKWVGTTTSDYVSQQDILTQDYKQAFIIIHNSSATATMYYKIYGYANNGATFYEEVVAETSIAVSTSETIKIANTAYSKMVILVKQNSAAGAFEISYNLKP